MSQSLFTIRKMGIGTVCPAKVVIFPLFLGQVLSCIYFADMLKLPSKGVSTCLATIQTTIGASSYGSPISEQCVARVDWSVPFPARLTTYLSDCAIYSVWTPSTALAALSLTCE